MRYAIYCNTPYQLFMAVCFAAGNCKPEDTCDLYVDVDNSPQNGEYVSEIAAQKLFSDIYILRRVIEKQRGIRKVAYKLMGYLTPRRMFAKSLENAVLPIKEQYDVVMISHLGIMARWFVFSFPYARVYLYEDGLWSYLKNQEYTMSSVAARFFQKLTGKGPDTIRFESMLLFCPEFYEGINKNIVQCIQQPFDNAETMRMIYKIFPQDDTSIYAEHKFILLGQPGDSVNKHLYQMTQDTEKQIVNIVNEIIASDILVRPHPRQDAEIYSSLHTDTRGLSWELSCINQLTDDSVLIGRYSTAQFTPKLLRGKEPVLIFTNLLYPSEESSKMADIQDSIERLRKMYVNQQRIYCPKSFDEFKKILLKESK